MKKILALFSFLLIASAFIAQTTEGHISYSINVTSEDPEMEMAMSMFEGAEMDIYFNEEFSRSDIQMGMMMKISSITDIKSEKVLMLMGGMIGNKAVMTTINEMGDSEETDEEEGTIELLKDKKTIQGYKCKKAIITDKEGNEVTYWYTTKLDIKVQGNQFMNARLPGFPMEISAVSEKMTMTFIATEVSEKVASPETTFDMTVPEGYEEMSYEEFSKMGQ